MRNLIFVVTLFSLTTLTVAWADEFAQTPPSNAKTQEHLGPQISYKVQISQYRPTGKTQLTGTSRIISCDLENYVYSTGYMDGDVYIEGEWTYSSTSRLMSSTYCYFNTAEQYNPLTGNMMSTMQRPVNVRYEDDTAPIEAPAWSSRKQMTSDEFRCAKNQEEVLRAVSQDPAISRYLDRTFNSIVIQVNDNSSGVFPSKSLRYGPDGASEPGVLILKVTMDSSKKRCSGVTDKSSLADVLSSWSSVKAIQDVAQLGKSQGPNPVVQANEAFFKGGTEISSCTPSSSNEGQQARSGAGK